MSVRIVAFACQFRCGRIGTKEKAITIHEKSCASNPSRRACKTCKHDKFDTYEPDTGAGGFGYCDINARPDNKPMVVECDHYQPIEKIK